MIENIYLTTNGKGLYEFTEKAAKIVKKSNASQGLATFFIRHTSASLIIQENADLSCKIDLENYLENLVPENTPGFTHTMEGPDDMPAHIKSMLTSTSIGIPVVAGKLYLGAWQGIFLWEHRSRSHKRQIVMHLA